MDVRFPDPPLYRRFCAPRRVERDIRDVELVRWAPADALSTGRYRP